MSCAGISINWIAEVETSSSIGEGTVSQGTGEGGADDLSVEDGVGAIWSGLPKLICTNSPSVEDEVPTLRRLSPRYTLL